MRRQVPRTCGYTVSDLQWLAEGDLVRRPAAMTDLKDGS